jgi:hypothetical protein
MKKILSDADKAFARGAALVCGIVAREWRTDDAKYLMDCVGLDEKQCRQNEVDETDMDRLKSVFALQRKEKRRAARTKQMRIKK